MVDRDNVFSNDREVLFEIANIIAWTKYRNGFKKLLKAVKTFIKICATKYELSGERHEWMFMDTVPRKDHRQFFELVKEQCPYDKGEFIWKKKRTVNFRGLCDVFRFLNQFGKLKYIEIPKVSDNLEKLKYIPETLGEHVLLYLNLVANLQMKYAIEEYDWSGVKSLVTLYDIGKPEHFVTISANQHGLKTVVMSHGIMFSNFDYKDLNTFNMYKVPSKYFLGLGEDVVALAKKFGSDTEVIVCGQIKIKEQEYRPDENLIAVAAEIPAHYKENVAMIQIAERYAKENGMRVRVRLHPTDKQENYDIDESVCTFEKDIDNACVIISYTSSMLFTYMALGKRTMRYNGPQPYYTMPDEILFKDYDEFATKISKIKDLDFRQIAKEHIDCIGEESAAKYRKAFEYIESK